jgi:hypothetical protein
MRRTPIPARPEFCEPCSTQQNSPRAPSSVVSIATDARREFAFPGFGIAVDIDGDHSHLRSATNNQASLADHSASKNKNSGTRVAHVAAAEGWSSYLISEEMTDRGSAPAASLKAGWLTRNRAHNRHTGCRRGQVLWGFERNVTDGEFSALFRQSFQPLQSKDTCCHRIYSIHTKRPGSMA